MDGYGKREIIALVKVLRQIGKQVTEMRVIVFSLGQRSIEDGLSIFIQTTFRPLYTDLWTLFGKYVMYLPTLNNNQLFTGVL